MWFWIILQLVTTFGLISYFYIRKKYSYWSDRGVSGPRAIFPFGYTWDKARHDPFELELSWLSRYGKRYGVYTGLEPTLILADPEDIKQVLIKDFTSFANRRALNSYHPIFNYNYFSVDYEPWKIYRSMTSPAFSNRQLRAMNPRIRRSIGKLLDKLEIISRSPSDGLFKPNELFTSFTLDIITATFFATEIDSHSNSGSETNPIVKQCIALVNISSLKATAVNLLPRPILNLLGFTSVFNEQAMTYICDLLRSVVRKQKALPAHEQNEFIRLLISPEGARPSLSENEVIAQCLLFFNASIEQLTSALTYAAYELALNPSIQERLLADIRKVAGQDQSDDNDVWERLMGEVPYLEAVIKESMRKYPPELRLERRVTAPGGATIGDLFLEKDTLIEVPTIALHHNPEFFPEPERFNPERFMPENRDQLNPYAYLTFGLGPRNCLGFRFSYQVLKMALASLLLKFRFEVAPDTPLKLAFISGNLSLLMPEFSLKVERRR